MRLNSLYVHIPFCLRKCHYCDFVSVPMESAEQLASYGELLLQELALYQQQLDFSALQTVYFGGGTPSLLAPASIGALLQQLLPVAEVTLEANPETVTAAKLQQFLQAGVNRLSLGVQSFDDQLLAAMGRSHSGEQAAAAVAAGRTAGFKNISLDLIYGLPQQTMEQWQEDVQQTVALDVEHVSLYCLTLEGDTPWTRAAASGQLLPADEDAAAEMYEYAVDYLGEHNFCHYEISNFARPGYASQHNTAYWQRKNYLGLGVAAASCLADCRLVNTADLADYAAHLAAGKRPVAEQEQLEIEMIIAEAVFLGLRLTAGIDFAAFKQQYGVDVRQRYKSQIRNLQAKGLLAVGENSMYLTRRGLLLGNQVFMEFV